MAKATEAARKRVLVALDSLPGGRALLATAAELAAKWDAELVGLFVEDIDLLNVAALPFCREFGIAHGEERTLDPAAMARALRIQAERMREAVASAAERTQVPYSFRVTRGRVEVELLEACREAELVVVGRARSTSSRSVRLGSTTRTVLSRGSCTVVIARENAPVGRPVLAVFDGSAVSGRALAAAARLVEQDHRNLAVVVAAENVEHGRRLERKVASVLQRSGIVPRTIVVRRPTLADLVALIRKENSKTLVLPADLPLLAAPEAASMIESLLCPVVLVR
jgi:nucleotide-binding universal stress UspA family protein